MSTQLRIASALSVLATVMTTLITSAGSGAAAQATLPRPGHPAALSAPAVPADPQPLAATSSADPRPMAEATAANPAAADVDGDDAGDDPAAARPAAHSLAALVDHTPLDSLSRELSCLAGAIYFEAKGEPLVGQLAVGRVIVARTHSGRFPTTYCGVVYQHSQFSFVRGGVMPGINRASAAWRNAARIARIAHAGAWKNPAEGALYFHARRVSPSWNRVRLAQIGNHVFYR